MANSYENLGSSGFITRPTNQPGDGRVRAGVHTCACVIFIASVRTREVLLEHQENLPHAIGLAIVVIILRFLFLPPSNITCTLLHDL